MIKRAIAVHEILVTPIDVLLDIWTRYQHKPDINLGFKRKDSILRSDGASDSAQIMASLDEIVAQGVDACINSLKAQHCWAIKKRCGISSIWSFAQIDFFAALKDAETELEKKLKKNVATSNYYS